MYKNNYKNLPIDINRSEWDKFWEWMWSAGVHCIGPLATKIYNNPEQQELDEKSISFFLKYKKQILTKPPTGKDKKVFEQIAMRY